MQSTYPETDTHLCSFLHCLYLTLILFDFTLLCILSCCNRATHFASLAHFVSRICVTDFFMTENLHQGHIGLSETLFMGKREKKYIRKKRESKKDRERERQSERIDRRRTNVQQLTCNIDLSSSFYLFFSFVLIQLKPLVLKGKVLGEKF